MKVHIIWGIAVAFAVWGCDPGGGEDEDAGGSGGIIGAGGMGGAGGIGGAGGMGGAGGALECEGEDPRGCFQIGCSDGQECIPTGHGAGGIGPQEGALLDVCVPSNCRCHLGFWDCTADCSGGICQPVEPDPCSEHPCGEHQTCEIYQPTGEAYCADTCEGRECERGTHCELAEVQCVRAPCPPVAQCVPDAEPCGPNPQGCRESGCPEGQECVAGEECIPSACQCDPSGAWICTEDCGGGACQPVNPDPCANHPCEEHQTCEIFERTGEAYCADTCEGRECGEGEHCELFERPCDREHPCPPAALCVPDENACGPNPEGCRNNGCADGQECVVGDACIPSSCRCDPDSGQWGCTRDCGGGACQPVEGGACQGANPQGCNEAGCPEGQACVVGDECVPSACGCEPDSGQWLCTADCGGGVCQGAADPCADHPCRRGQACQVFEGEAYCADTCEGRECARGTHCELVEVQCVRAPCPPVAQCVPNNAELQWFFTCGDPVCRGHSPRDDIPRCNERQIAGDPCRAEGRMCDPGDQCNALLICANSDPRLEGCPISKREYKTAIKYVEAAERDLMAQKLNSIKLAKWRYRTAPASSEHFGFIIDDGVPAEILRTRGDQVDLYGYTSLTVAAIQSQAEQLKQLRAELEQMKVDLKRCQ